VSNWNQFDFENRIRNILSSKVYKPERNHHFGRPFMTAYQIAIEFNMLYPNVAHLMAYQVGGKGTNQHVSLSQYIALQLSQRIKSNQITDIEGGFLSNNYINKFEFNNNGIDLKSSLIGTDYDHAIFRFIG
jgi:hypothetical protein